MITTAFAAMGTQVMVRCNDEATAQRCRRLFRVVERTCSRFLMSSELSAINRAPAGSVRVSALMGQVLEAAARMRDLSGGLVDPGVGSDVVSWGYADTFFEVEDVEEPPRTVPSSMAWEIEGRDLAKKAGVMLDLGGLAKGWTADLAVEQTGAAFVNAGGDVRSSDPRAAVDLVDPWGRTITRLALGVGALATSSVTRRSWRVGGAKAHHIIDPRTRAPADSPILQASVVADRAVEAETGAKAVILHGEEGLAWADGCPWIRGAVAVWKDGSVYGTTDLELAA